MSAISLYRWDWTWSIRLLLDSSTNEDSGILILALEFAPSLPITSGSTGRGAGAERDEFKLREEILSRGANERGLLFGLGVPSVTFRVSQSYSMRRAGRARVGRESPEDRTH